MITDGTSDPEEEWQYEPGDLVVDTDQHPMPEMDSDFDPAECEVDKRLVDNDTEKKYYWLEVEKDNRIINHLYSAKVVHTHYEKVGEIEDG